MGGEEGPYRLGSVQLPGHPADPCPARWATRPGVTPSFYRIKHHRASILASGPAPRTHPGFVPDAVSRRLQLGAGIAAVHPRPQLPAALGREHLAAAAPAAPAYRVWQQRIRGGPKSPPPGPPAPPPPPAYGSSGSAVP